MANDGAADDGPPEASDMEAEDVTEITMTKSWNVALPGMRGRAWSPEFKEVVNSVFLKVGKYDRTFSKWVTGKTLNMSNTRETSLACKAFTSLVLQRKAASVSAVCSARGENKQRVTESDSALVEPTVHIEVKDVNMRMLWGIGRDPFLWVEYSPANLNALKALIMDCKGNNSNSPKKKPRGRKPKPNES